MSEDILCHIMTRLSSQLTASSHSEYYLNVLKVSKFWRTILCATGNVEKLNSNSLVRRVKESINELGGLLLNKAIDIELLQQILKYSDEELFHHFDAAVAKNRNKVLGDVIVPMNEIVRLRKICNEFQRQYGTLFKFYSTFCQ